MVTMKTPSEVFTVNVSPVRRVITPLFLTLSPELAPNAGATAKLKTAKRHAVIAMRLLNMNYLLDRSVPPAPASTHKLKLPIS
jgi:hypothetical protein